MKARKRPSRGGWLDVIVHVKQYHGAAGGLLGGPEDFRSHVVDRPDALGHNMFMKWLGRLDH